MAGQVSLSSHVFNLVNTCYRSTSTKAWSCYHCKGLKKPCGMKVPKKRVKKTKTEVSGAAEKLGAAKTSRATGGMAERSGSAATDGTAELMRLAWAIVRELGGIWGELREVKKLLGVIAYKEEDNEDTSESEESEGTSPDRVTGLQEEKEENERRKEKGKGKKIVEEDDQSDSLESLELLEEGEDREEDMEVDSE